MHPSVPARWIKFNEPHEGRVPYMYGDIKGLVTIGMGNLIDPLSAAVTLPFRMRGTGTIALKSAVVAAWRAVKDDPKCATEGSEYARDLPDNGVYLEDEDIDKLILRKLEQNDASFLRRFGDWESRPADAQMAAHSMGWAMGPGFWTKFPRFTAAFTKGDYKAACAKVGQWPAAPPAKKGLIKYECDIAPIVVNGKLTWGTIKDRNQRNRELLLSAADV